ncbi:MAG: hypothetical protein AAFN40_14340 [Cyanobacteria bacterium J06560_6]
MMPVNEQYKSAVTDDEVAKSIAQKVLQDGYVEFPNFLTRQAWESLATFAEDRSFGNTKKAALAGTIAHKIAFSDEIYKFSDRIYKNRCELEGREYTPLKPSKQVVGLPYKDGRNGKTNSATRYHFDGAYINITIPIVLPQNPKKNGGSLTIFPNLRKRYGVLLSKFIGRGLRHSSWLRERWGFEVIHYQPGAGYVFFGDISLHGVAPISAGERMVMTINSHW